MNTLDYLTIAISLITGVISLFMSIRMAIKSKNEYLKIKITKKYLSNCIKEINENSKIYSKQLDDIDEVKMGLHWYCYSIIDILKDIYPKCNFSVSIKMFRDDTVDTILRAGDELFIDEGKQLVSQNTEYNVIVKEKYKYFFVTDLDKYNEKVSKYENSDSEWKYKYNTSIVFPIKTEDRESTKLIGFVCINSPQKLKKQRNNDLLIRLIKETCDSIASHILQYRNNI